MTQSAHIFVDNSNIFGGAQRAASKLVPPEPWLAIRVYCRNFFQLIEHGYSVATRILAGSVPPGTEDLWNHAERAGYDTKLLRKVERDDGRLGEQAVDELLQLKMLETALDYRPGCLVLATGDGKPSETGSSFIAQVQRALKIGWTVDVWSWSLQLSPRFRGLQEESANFAQVHLLDRHFESITFCKGGDYLIDGVSRRVDERVVQPVRL